MEELKDIERAKRAGQAVADVIVRIVNKKDATDARLATAVEALKHYANGCHWRNADLALLDDNFFANEYDFDRNGYSIAREALAKIGDTK